MAWTTILNRAPHQAGSSVLGPLNVPVGATLLRYRVARYEKMGNGKRKKGTELPAGEQRIYFDVDVSEDAGDTWRFTYGGGITGGIVSEPAGQTPAEDEREWSEGGFSISNPSNPDRQLRLRTEIAEPLQTTVEVDLGV